MVAHGLQAAHAAHITWDLAVRELTEAGGLLNLLDGRTLFPLLSM